MLSSQLTFPHAKIKVAGGEEGGNASVTVVEYSYLGSKRSSAAYPIVLTALAGIKYHTEAPPFSIFRFLMNNPMMLMMGASALIMVAFPKIMEGIDPEELKKMQGELTGAPSTESEATVAAPAASAAK